MNESELRGLVEEQWTALETGSITAHGRLRASDLPVVVDTGPLVLAVDHDGFRHVLLPVATHSKVRQGLNGPVLRLSKRRLEDAVSYQAYADLACLRHDLDDLFTELCVDVLVAVEKMPDKPLRALYRVLDRWKALFQTQGPPLHHDQLVGLLGELMVLLQLLRHDASAHRLWRGPEGHRHDFLAGPKAVEVKTAADGEGRRARIHGLDQLDPPENGTLCVVWFRLHRGGADGEGVSLPELAAEALRLCDDESALLGLLARAGYHPADAERYRDSRFAVAEEMWYEVGPDFPRLTTGTLAAAGVAVTVWDVEYTIELSGSFVPPLSRGQVAQVIDGMIQEAV